MLAKLQKKSQINKVYLTFLCFFAILKFVDVSGKTGLDVSGLVLVDNIGLSQLVQHLLYTGVQLCCLFFVGHSTQFANSITHGLGIIVVMLCLFLVLTNSLQG